MLAGLFAGALNLAVVGRWVWVEAFAPGWLVFFAALASGTWAMTLAYTGWWLWRCHPERHLAEIDRLFREAMELYLQGKWRDSIQRCEEILARDESDAEALLQIGLVRLRAGQPLLARQAFRDCLKTERGAQWRWEIEHALAGATEARALSRAA
jgi:tetratricopeptide (TPR) repeat protein